MKKALSLFLLLVLPIFANSQQRPAITGIAFVRMYTADAAASATSTAIPLATAMPKVTASPVIQSTICSGSK